MPKIHLDKYYKTPGQFVSEFYFIINNTEIKDRILDVLKTTDWANVKKHISAYRINMWEIVKVLKEQISEIK